MLPGATGFAPLQVKRAGRLCGYVCVCVAMCVCGFNLWGLPIAMLCIVGMKGKSMLGLICATPNVR